MVTIRRGAGAAMLSAMAAPEFNPILLLHVDWPGGALRATTNPVPMSWQGQLWEPFAPIGGIDVPPEVTGGLAAPEFTLWVLGSIDALLDLMDETAARNRSVECYLGLVTHPGVGVLVDEPVPLVLGRLDGNRLDYQQTDQGPVPRGTWTARSGPSARMAVRAVHSDEDQQARHPGDTGFRHTALIELYGDNPPVWPAP